MLDHLRCADSRTLYYQNILNFGVSWWGGGGLKPPKSPTPPMALHGSANGYRGGYIPGGGGVGVYIFAYACRPLVVVTSVCYICIVST